MEKLLMVGSCKGGQELIEEAKARNIYTIIADNCEIGKTKFPIQSDERWIIDTSNIDELEKKCRANNVTAVINAISTFNITVTMELCKRLNLPCYCSPEAWHYTVDKLAFKKLCKDNCVPVAQSYEVSTIPTMEELGSIKYPVVVKAIDQSANRGMSYCYCESELIAAIKYARSVSKSDKVIIERKLNGTEYGAHYAIVNGKANMFGYVSMLSEPGEMGNCYSITTTEADNLPIYLKEVDPYFKKVLYNGNMHNGVAWIEMILDEDGHFYVLEMGYRLSGDMMALPLKNVTGFDSYKWLLDISTGKKQSESDLPAQQIRLFERCGCAYILWSNDSSGTIGKISGINLLDNDSTMKIIYDVREGSAYRKNQYLITFVFDSDTPEMMCSKIKEINKKIRIYDVNGNSIAIYFTDYERIHFMHRHELEQEGRYE